MNNQYTILHLTPCEDFKLSQQFNSNMAPTPGWWHCNTASINRVPSSRSRDYISFFTIFQSHFKQT